MEAEPQELSVEEERQARIAELEARLKKRNPFGAVRPVAIAALVASAFLLWLDRRDVAYFFSPRAPITLGVEGDYHFDRARSNRYAEIHGIPTSRGAYSMEDGRTFVVLGVRETPLLVRRETLPGEEWTPPATPPRPLQNPFGLRGRLLSREDASRYEDGFKKLESFGEVKPRWILVQGPPPGRDVRTALWLLFLSAFAAVNVWLLVRDARQRRLARQDASR